MSDIKKLTRKTQNEQIAGVCAGLADYFNLDVTVVRLIFVLMAIFGGPGLLLYIILWVIMPEDERKKKVEV